MRHALLLVCASLFASTVIAADTQPFQWNPQTFDFVASGDVATGKGLAQKFRCKKCHNDDGVSDDPEIPTIAGQRATYLFKQMTDYKNGFRENRDMNKAMRRVSAEDMAHVSAWFASLERPAPIGGDRLLVVKVCDSCHEKDVVEEEGRIEVAPVLNGQIRQYLEATMMAFKQADRSNDLFKRMQSVSHKLTDSEIRTLSRYYGAAELEP
jgi:cytochrome c553